MQYFLTDLARMYSLVSRIPDGLGQLMSLLETHICNQGFAAIEKCGETAVNVSLHSFHTLQCVLEKNRTLKQWNAGSKFWGGDYYIYFMKYD